MRVLVLILLALVCSLASCSLVIDFDDPATEIRLTEMTVLEGELKPAFDPAVTSYTVALPPTEGFTIRAGSDNDTATITIAGQPGLERVVDVRPGGRQDTIVAIESTSGVATQYRITAQVSGIDFEDGCVQGCTQLATPPRGLMVASFDGIAARDLAVFQGAVTTLLGSGTGLFTTGATIASSSGGNAAAVGDLDEDGFDDVVLVGTSELIVALNNRDGTFTQSSSSIGIFNDSVAIGELTGDDHLDIAIVSADNGTILMVGDGNGGFVGAGTIGPGGRAAAVGDVAGTPDTDLVTVDTATSHVYVHQHVQGAQFLTVDHLLPKADAAAIGDIDGDGTQELGLACATGGTILVFDAGPFQSTGFASR